jgi:pimeloyl-ACP methyl ester carboxylesterase
MSNYARFFLTLLGVWTGVASAADVTLRSETAHVNGVDVHYLIAGTGEPVVLIHGYVETSQMWRPLIAELARTHLVIAPDLRGVGGSSVTDAGYDKVSMAGDIHALVGKLGFKKATIIGHDVGLMVAYAYAASWPQEVSRLALLDAPIPGIGPEWDLVLANPQLWHFHFVNSPIALDLVTGRERLFFDHFWMRFGTDSNAVKERDKTLYAETYAKPGSMKAGFEWFRAFPKDAQDNRAFAAAGKLRMPLLTIAGEKSMGDSLGAQAGRVAENIHSIILPGAGHWLMEERTGEVVRLLSEFVRGDISSVPVR